MKFVMKTSLVLLIENYKHNIDILGKQKVLYSILNDIVITYSNVRVCVCLDVDW